MSTDLEDTLRELAPRVLRCAAGRLGDVSLAIVVATLWPGRQPSPTPPPADLLLTRAGAAVMIQSASGETLILGPRRPGEARRPGAGWVVVEGSETGADSS